MIEAIGAMLSYIGINNTVAVEEPGVFNPRAVSKPTEQRAYAWLHVRNNPLRDFGAELKSHTGCEGIISVYGDPEYEARLDKALTLSGKERHEALKVQVKENHD
jgi:ABC-type dipeptide transport system, periplasmic component